VNKRMLLLLLVAIALGMAAGYMVRRWREPSIGERAQDAAETIRRGVEKVVR
jgi:hypothetical protein